MDFLSKHRIEDFTEDEFLRFVKEFFEGANNLEGKELEDYLSKLALHFVKVTGHPAGYGLFSHPDHYGIEDSPEAAVEAVKKWREANGLPGFNG